MCYANQKTHNFENLKEEIDKRKVKVNESVKYPNSIRKGEEYREVLRYQAMPTDRSIIQAEGRIAQIVLILRIKDRGVCENPLK